MDDLLSAWDAILNELDRADREVKKKTKNGETWVLTKEKLELSFQQNEEWICFMPAEKIGFSLIQTLKQ